MLVLAGTVSFCLPLTPLTCILALVPGSVALLLIQRAEFPQGGRLSILSLLKAGREGKDRRLEGAMEGRLQK